MVAVVLGRECFCFRRTIQSAEFRMQPIQRHQLLRIQQQSELNLSATERAADEQRQQIFCDSSKGSTFPQLTAWLALKLLYPESVIALPMVPMSSTMAVASGERRGSLNWKQRYDIILGTARGLTFLHEEFYVCIIDRDIKSSSILLDDDFQHKIADFGLARLLPEDRSHLSTKFAGTLGYTSPEYAIHGQLSEKADIYSYGIVVLEIIISGQRSHETNAEPDAEFLLKTDAANTTSPTSENSAAI
ncbi:hypothetical protein POUND7_013388 [Theobroma cacao]